MTTETVSSKQEASSLHSLVRRFPRPWGVDSWRVSDGRSLYAVRAFDHEMILECGEDEERAAAVVVACNEGSDQDAIASIQERWQRALNAKEREVEVVRRRWHEEAGQLSSLLYEARAEIEALRQKAGELNLAPNTKLRHAGPETHECKPQREPALPAANC